MSDSKRVSTRVSKTASDTSGGKRTVVVKHVDSTGDVAPLTQNEIRARMQKRANAHYSTTSFGFNSRTAYAAGLDVTGSTQGNFYSPQLSTDFLEKPQNLRERRAWYRHFYNQNEFVGQAIDLHSTLPISKIKLDKPKCENQDYADYIYDFFVDMCQDMKLTSKTLIEISHEFWLLGNCVEKSSRLRSIDGYKKAEEVNIGDFILTHRGRFRRVVKKCSREVNLLKSIKFWKTPDILKITDEHPLEVYRDGNFKFIQVKDLKEEDYVRLSWLDETKDVSSINYLEDFKQIKINKEGYTRDVFINKKRDEKAQLCRRLLLSWLSSLEAPVIKTRDDIAKFLGVGRKTLDNVLTQLNKEVGKEAISRRLGASGYQKGSQVEWLPLIYDPGDGFYEIKRVNVHKAPHTIDIDENFCYLLGYWLGDGTLARDRARPNEWGRGIWNIVFGENSKFQKEKILSILENSVGLNIKEFDTYKEYYEGKISKVTTLRIRDNPAFVEWWSSSFGETSHGDNKKRIPDWVLRLPENKLYALIAGIIDSDGCLNKKGYHIELTSENIIRPLREILLKCGIVCSLSKKDVKYDSKMVSYVKGAKKRSYRIYVNVRDCCEKICKHTIKNPSEENIAEERPQLLKFVKTDDGKIAFKIKSIEEEEYNDVVYNFEVEEDHTYQVEGFSTHNCFIYAEDHDPYNDLEDYAKEEIKGLGKIKTKELYEKFKIIDKDPNYMGFRKLVVLPPDQVRIKKIPLSDDIMIEFIPDPETKKTLTNMSEGNIFSYDANLNESEKNKLKLKLPESLVEKLKNGGAIPLDTDPYSGSHVYHMARKKCQYETMGVSILERCINTLLLHDKLRQAQQSIASRHMTPIRIVWAEDLSYNDVDNLREQVDLALVDPDFSIITNFQVNWEEMGSNGRLLELTSEYDHIENSLFAGLGVTREILTGEGTYAGSQVSLEVLNTQYLLFRELVIDYIENNIFKPVAKKKGFEFEDKFGRRKLIYPKVSFTRLAIRDNASFFDQAFNLFNKGNLSVDVILEMMNIDPVTTKKKVESDLFTVSDPAFNQLMQNMYTAMGQIFAERYNVDQKIADYLDVQEKPAPPTEEGGAEAGGLGGGLMGRFSSTLGKNRQTALNKIMEAALRNPDKLDTILKFLNGAK